MIVVVTHCRMRVKLFQVLFIKRILISTLISLNSLFHLEIVALVTLGFVIANQMFVVAWKSVKLNSINVRILLCHITQLGEQNPFCGYCVFYLRIVHEWVLFSVGLVWIGRLVSSFLVTHKYTHRPENEKVTVFRDHLKIVQTSTQTFLSILISLSIIGFLNCTHWAHDCTP